MSNITAGGVTVAIYGTAAGAIAYLAGSVHGAAWNALSSAQRNNALATATRMFERTTWVGDPTDTIDKSDFVSQPANTQPLQWPRTSVTDRNGDAVPSSVIPLDLIDAAYELALDVSASDSVVQNQTASRQAKRVRTREKVDVIDCEEETEYFANTARTGRRFPLIVEELIGIWIASNIRTALSATSGTDITSSFTDADTDFGFAGSGLP